MIIVLAFLVILTGIVVAYFSRSISGLQVASSSSSAAKANVLEKSALDVIVSDLKQEIAAGSTITGTSAATGGQANWAPIYLPTSGTTAVPFRSGVPLATATQIPNLISRSVRPSNTAGAAPYVAYPSTSYNSPPPPVPRTAPPRPSAAPPRRSMAA